MKKPLAFLLALALLLSLAACGGKSSAAGSQAKPSSAVPASSAAQSTAPQSSAAPAQSGNKVPSDQIADCAGVYDFYEKLTDRMNRKLSDLQDAHNKAAGDNFSALVNLWYMPFSSLRYLDAASFKAGTSASAVESAFRMMGQSDATITENGNEYIVSYTATDYPYSEKTYAFKEVIRYDPQAPALSVVQYRDGELRSFTEFQALGDDRYALSSELERAIVTYRDGKIVAMDHAENKWDIDSDTGEYEDYSFVFDYESIFGKTDIDADWVTEAEKHDGLYHRYELEDDVCRISGLTKKFDWNGGPPTFEPGYEITLP